MMFVMRILFLTALLFVFSVGGFASLAHAATDTHSRVHYTEDGDDVRGSDICTPDHEHESGQCDDCCCSHVHVMATFSTPESALFSTGKKQEPSYSERYHSHDTDSLYRPPRS